MVHPAPKRFRNLHAHDYRELALVGDLPGLKGILDDPEPALARTTLLRVDVVLHLVHPLRLELDAVELVAGVLRLVGRIDLAEHPVLDQQVRVEAQAAAPGPLQPLVVALFVSQRVVGWPVSELRPSGRVVGVSRIAATEGGVLKDRATTFASVVGTVDQRVGDPVLVEGSTAMGASAKGLIGHLMHVTLIGPGHLAVSGESLAWLTDNVGLGLGIGRALRCVDEHEQALATNREVGPGVLVDQDVAVTLGLDPPLRGAGGRRVLAQVGAEELLINRVEQVLAEGGRLHAEMSCAADRARRGVVAAACRS